MRKPCKFIMILKVSIKNKPDQRIVNFLSIILQILNRYNISMNKSIIDEQINQNIIIINTQVNDI